MNIAWTACTSAPLPKITGEYLIVYRQGAARLIGVLDRDADGTEYINDRYIKRDITHWAPMPELPTE